MQAEQPPPRIAADEKLYPRPPENHQDAAKSLCGAHLLLVEDNAVNRELVLEILDNAGIRADVARNGAEGVEMVGRSDYDGVLMDCQMPVMDGFEATRKIRADGRFDDLPIIAMTANALSGDREICLESGMNDHIAKPINVGHFFLTLSRWIRPSSSQEHQDKTADRKKPPEEGEAPRLAGVSTDEALECVNGNVALYRKILAAFRKDQADAVARIRAAWRSGERKTAILLAHTLKGLAGNVGAFELAKAVKALEAALRAEQNDLADTSLESVNGLLNALLGEIDRAMPRGADTLPLPSDTAVPAADLWESQAFLDALTAIPNRRCFDEALGTEWRRALRAGTPLAVIMLDVDHFKAYNDRYGHEAGDICLKKLAAALASETACRSADLIARYGGEEFIALLPETDTKGAHWLAERLRARVEALQIPHGYPGASPWVTISVGCVSVIPAQDNSAMEMVEKADLMLYQAKERGRNRVYGALSRPSASAV